MEARRTKAAGVIERLLGLERDAAVRVSLSLSVQRIDAVVTAGRMTAEQGGYTVCEILFDSRMEAAEIERQRLRAVVARLNRQCKRRPPAKPQFKVYPRPERTLF